MGHRNLLGCLVVTACVLGLIIHYPVGGTRVSDSPVVLVTGFEAFGNYSVNPSGLIAEELNGTMLGNVRVIGIVLPVNFTSAVEEADAAIDQYQPVLVISMGLNARWSCLSVEHWGVDLWRDVQHGVKVPRRLDPRGPWVRPVSIPVGLCVAGLRDAGIPVRSSWWAGMYVCNAVLYGELGHVQEKNLSASVGFVHVPLLDSQDAAGLPLETEVAGVRIVIESSL
jgi:pyroglutamyl-peptidase